MIAPLPGLYPARGRYAQGRTGRPPGPYRFGPARRLSRRFPVGQERARQLTKCGTITEKAADLLISMADFFINRRA